MAEKDTYQKQILKKQNNQDIQLLNDELGFEEAPDFDTYEKNADKYLRRDVFKGTPLTGKMFREGAEKAYEETGTLVPLDIALSQAQFESHFGTKGRSPKNNPFNVGEFDSGTKMTFNSPEEGVGEYYKLMANDYLNDKEPEALLKNFVNKKGYRYASNPEYETKIADQSKFINNFLTKDQTKDFQKADPNIAVQEVDATPEGIAQFKKQSILDIQTKLKEKGYDPGPLDGINGSQTKGAVREYQKDKGLKIDGIVGPETRSNLFSSLMNFIDPPAYASDAPDAVNFDAELGFEPIEDDGIGFEPLSEEDLDFEAIRPNFIESVLEVAKGVVRGTQGIVASTGGLIDVVGQNIQRAGSQMAFRAPTGQMTKEDRNKNAEQWMKVGNIVSKWGKTANDYWTKASQEGFMQADPELFRGEFMENKSWTRGATIIAEAIPSLGAATVASMAAGGNPMVGLAFLGGLEAQGTFAESREAGKNIDDANRFFMMSAIGTSVLESIPLSRFVRGGEGKLIKDMFVGMGKEGIEEVLQNLWQNVIAKVGYDKTRSLTEGMVESLIGGAGSGGVVGALSSGRGKKLDSEIKNAINNGVPEAAINAMEEGITNQIVDNADVIEEVLQKGKSVDQAIDQMAQDTEALANEEVSPEVKEQLKDFQTKSNIAVEEVLPAEQLPELAPEQKQDEFEQVTISGALGYQPTQKQKPKVKKTFTPEQLAAAREGKPIELTSDQQKVKLPVYRSEDKIIAFKEGAEVMRNLMPGGVTEDKKRLPRTFPILANENITQEKLAKIEKRLENNEELGVDQQRIFNLVSEQILDVKTVAEDEIDTVQQFINQYKESFPDVTDAQLKEIYEEARQETEDSWDEEIEQAVIKGFVQKADQSRKSAEQTEITPSGQIRLELQAPIPGELFQEKGELFEGLGEKELIEKAKALLDSGKLIPLDKGIISAEYKKAIAGKPHELDEFVPKIVEKVERQSKRYDLRQENLEKIKGDQAREVLNTKSVKDIEKRIQSINKEISKQREIEGDALSKNQGGRAAYAQANLEGLNREKEVLEKAFELNKNKLFEGLQEPPSKYGKQSNWKRMASKLSTEQDVETALERLYASNANQEIIDVFETRLEEVRQTDREFEDELGADEDEFIASGDLGVKTGVPQTDLTLEMEEPINMADKEFAMQYGRYLENKDNLNSAGAKSIEELASNLRATAEEIGYVKGGFKGATDKQLIEAAEDAYVYFLREPSAEYNKPLTAAEAVKQGMSKEEWVGKQKVVYHGTNQEFDNIEIRKSLKAVGQPKGAFFVDNISEAKEYGKNVKEYYVEFKNPLIGNPREIYAKEKGVEVSDVKMEELEAWLKQKGYDVIIRPAGSQYNLEGAEYIALDKSAIKTKSQLEAEYDAAQASQGVAEPEAQYSFNFTKAEKNAIIESETKAAYGSEQKYSENVRKALKDLEAIHSNKRSSDVRTLREIARKLEAREPIEYKGSEVTSAQDAAELFALYRHPFIEHFQIIFVKEGKVVSNRVLTSGAAAYVSLDESFGKEMKNEMDSIRADAVYIAHNHPAGNPDPSFADLKFTIAISDILGKKFKGHVVTNGDQYVLIDYYGSQKLNNFKTKKPDYFIASDQIKSIDAAARLARDVIATKAPSIMYFNNQMKFLMAETVTKTTVGEEINEGLKRNQARYAIVVHDKNTVKQRQLNLNNVYSSDFYGLRDYIIFDKDSYVSMADGEIYPYFKIQSGFPKGVTQILEKPAEYNSDFEGKKTPLKLLKTITEESFQQEIYADFGEVAKARTRKISGSVLEAVSELINTDYDLALDIVFLKKSAPNGLTASEIFTGLKLKALAEQDIDTLYKLVEAEELAKKGREYGQFIKGFDAGLENDPVKVAKAINKERDEVNKGKSDKQREAEVKKLQEMLSETEKRLTEVEGELKKIKEAKDRQPRGSFGSKNKIVKQDQFEQARQALKLKLANSISEPPAEYNKKTDAGESSILDDVTTMGMFYFEGGVKNYNEWARLIESDLGEKIKPYLQPAWKNVQNLYHQEELKELKERVVEKSVESQRVEDISYIVQLVAKSYVAQGVTSRETLVEKVRDLLKDAFPGITSREVADAISGYGKYSQLKQDQIEQKLSDIKGQLLQISKLEDMQKGKSPLRTGRERRAVSDEERRLIKLVDEAKKKYDIKVTDPRRQLRTALDEYKQRMRNQIVDLQKQIEENKQFIKKPTDLKLDADAKTLTDRRDELRKMYREIFGKKEMSVEKRIELAEKSLKRSIEQYEEKIAKGDISPLTKKKTPLSTPKLEELRTKQNALKDQLKMLRDMANPKKTAQEIALQSFKTRLKNEQETLLNRLENMDFAKKERKELELDLEAKELRSERDKIRRAFRAAQYNQDHLTKNEVAEIVRLSAIAMESKQKLLDSGDWTANNAENVEAFFQAKYDFDEYVDSLKPITASDVINNVVDYMRASILASPRILRNSFLYQIVPATERAIAKRIVSGAFDDANLQSTFTEKVMAKLSSMNFTKEEHAFMKKQVAMAIRIYHKTGYDISRTDNYDREPRYFGERVGKIKGKGVVSRIAKTVNLAPKWFAGGSDMLFANFGRVETTIMMAKERAKLESKKNLLPEGVTEQDRAKQLVIDSYSFETKDEVAIRIREAGIRDAHMMNNTQPGWWSDKVVAFRRGLSAGKINFGKALIPFAKIANVVIAEGAKTASGVGVAKAIYDINQATRESDLNVRSEKMGNAVNDLVRYGTLMGAAMLLAMLLDDDDYVGSWDTIGRTEYALARAQGAGANYVRIAGKWVPLRYLPMISIPISAIMSARQAKIRGKDAMAGYFAGMVGQILDAPGISESKSILERTSWAIKSDNMEKVIKSLGLDWEGMSNWAKVRAIPSVLSYDIYNAVFDQDKRYDFLGREIERGGVFKDDTSNDIILEYSRLSQKGLTPSIADPQSNSAKALKEELGEDKYYELLAGFKRDYAKEVEKKVNSVGYEKLPDEIKQKSLNKIRKSKINNALDAYYYRMSR